MVSPTTYRALNDTGKHEARETARMAAPVAGTQFDTATNHISKTQANVAMSAGVCDPDGGLVNHPNIRQMQYDTEGG